MATKTERKPRVRKNPADLKKNQPTRAQLAVMEALKGGRFRVRFYPGVQLQVSDVHCPIIEPLPTSLPDMLGGFVVRHARRETLNAMVRKGILTHKTVHLSPHLTCEEWALP